MDNNQLKLDGIYSINDGELNGNTISNKEIPVSGKKPSKGYLKYDNNNLVLACLKVGDYEVKYENNEFTSTGKGDCSTKGDFANDTWETIIANLSIDRHAYDDEIGKTKIIEFDRNGDNTNEFYKLRLVNTEPCTSSTARSKTSCGVVIEFVTTIGTHYMNSSNDNAGGWYDSSMRAYLNSETNNIYSKLPSDLQSVIISTSPVVSGSGSGGVSNDAEDYLYLLSTREVGLSVSYDNKNTATDTNILSYYNSNNNNNARKKYTTTTSSGEDSSASVYWLRSAYSSSTNAFYIVNSGGSINYNNSNYPHGVAPAFRILD